MKRWEECGLGMCSEPIYNHIVSVGQFHRTIKTYMPLSYSMRQIFWGVFRIEVAGCFPNYKKIPV